MSVRAVPPSSEAMSARVTELIGNTPLVQLHSIVPPEHARILVKSKRRGS